MTRKNCIAGYKGINISNVVAEAYDLLAYASYFGSAKSTEQTIQPYSSDRLLISAIPGSTFQYHTSSDMHQ